MATARRVWVQLAVVVASVLVPVVQAAGQTTSSSTSTSSSSTSSTSTTSTTSGLDAHCAVFECTPRPPDVFVSALAGEVKAVPGSFCWFPGGTPVGLCADTLGPNPTNPLRVTRGEVVSIRFAIRNTPTRVDVRHRADDQSGLLPLLATQQVGNPTTFRADLPLGQQVVYITSVWRQGDASHGVLLDVRAAAGESTRAPLRLTG